MADHELSELLKTQISLTEWLESIGHKNSAALRQEDGSKRERLGVIDDIIGLPFDRPENFMAIEITTDNPRFKKMLEERGTELCAFRLVPTEAGLPKLRNRGKSIKDAYEWYKEQKIDPTKYKVEVVPHNEDYHWATIFIVNDQGIFGEIVWGGHHRLTQGFHDENKPMVFSYDFKNWTIEPKNADALAHLKQLVEHIHVTDRKKQAELTKKLGSEFSHGYVKGYFETTDTGAGTWYIDYSLALGEMYADFKSAPARPTSKAKLVSGQVGCSGTATGKVVVVRPDNLDVPFPKGSVLVCNVTTPAFVPLMQKAAAIVTDQGGILSHAAIVARELKVPCIVGTKEATAKLKNGQVVTVDANAGIVSAAK